ERPEVSPDPRARRRRNHRRVGNDRPLGARAPAGGDGLGVPERGKTDKRPRSPVVSAHEPAGGLCGHDTGDPGPGTRLHAPHQQPGGQPALNASAIKPTPQMSYGSMGWGMRIVGPRLWPSSSATDDPRQLREPAPAQPAAPPRETPPRSPPPRDAYPERTAP